MTRVLVLADDSILADAIVLNLTQDIGLQVRRLTQQDTDQLYQELLEDSSVVILVEHGKSSRQTMTASDLLQNGRCGRVIVISAQEHSLQIYDGYAMPVSGMAQIVHLVKGLNREQPSEVKK